MVKPCSGSLGASSDFPAARRCVEDVPESPSGQSSRSAKQSLRFPFYSHKVFSNQATKLWVKLEEPEIITQGRGADGGVTVIELLLL